MALSSGCSPGPRWGGVGSQIVPSRLAIRLILVLVAGLVAGCASLLPKAKTETAAPWKSINEVKGTFDTIEPGRTTLAELKQLGYDPFVNPNVTVLHYSDVLNKYAPNAVRDEYLEPGIRECLKTQIKCSAYSIEHRQVRRDRVGNFLLDFINYERRVEITGWRFAAIVVVVDDRVVHKSWSGVPAISEVEESLNPLGLLQDSARSVIPLPALY